jgi:23S rRNA (uracil1939-C5)-methyltransferase
MAESIVRIAARGDGVSESGRHAAFAVPGDLLQDDGTLIQGPHHQVPPCRHFPECGGCQLQHADDEAYRGYLRSRIETALDQHGLIADVREAYLSPPKTRRRTTLRALKVGTSAVIGFNAEKSHRIVDMHECHVLRPELFGLVAPLRALLSGLLVPKRAAEIQMTLVEGGVDLLLRNLQVKGMAAEQALIGFAAELRLVRLSIDSGMGPETLWEPEPAVVTLSGSRVRFPVGAFLQATADGEAELVAAVREAVADAKTVADLFAGLGTFAMAIDAGLAAEASRDSAAALSQATPAMQVEHRDLYRRPLDSSELKPFDAIILDPPRAGAHQQIAELAQSAVPKIAYVSCNPATFARDAAILADGGYLLKWVKPVGQFRWSTHVELVAAFSR